MLVDVFFANLRVGPDDVLYGSQYDVKDFFYRILAPWEISRHFGLPPLSLEEVLDVFGESVAKLALGSASSDGAMSLSPFFRCLAMGFSWSFF